MPTIRRTVTVDRPLAEVWEFLADFTTTEEWDPGTVRTTRRSGDGGVGTVYDNVSKFAGRETKLVYTVEAVEPEHMIKLKGENKAVTATDTMTFTGNAERTIVEYVAVFDFHGLLRFAAPLMAPLFKKLGDNAAEGIAPRSARTDSLDPDRRGLELGGAAAGIGGLDGQHVGLDLIGEVHRHEGQPRPER